MKRFKNYYHALGVASTADDAEIKAAFRRLVRRHHPDVAQGKRAARRFLEIREAYDVLSDPERRRWYDRVYRAHTALRVMADVPRRKAPSRRQSRSGALGISVDLLGLRVGLSLDAGLRDPRATRQIRPPWPPHGRR